MYNSEARINEITIAYSQNREIFINRPNRLFTLMQHNESKYITLARINETNCCFQSYFRSIQEQAKQGFLS